MTPMDDNYGFPRKAQMEATDRLLIQDKNNVIHSMTGAAFAALPSRDTPQTGDAILAVDENGNLFRIEGFSGTRVINAETYTFSNGVLVSVTA